jgi:hypothetical protein
MAEANGRLSIAPEKRILKINMRSHHGKKRSKSEQINCDIIMKLILRYINNNNNNNNSNNNV